MCYKRLESGIFAHSPIILGFHSEQSYIKLNFCTHLYVGINNVQKVPIDIVFASKVIKIKGHENRFFANISLPIRRTSIIVIMKITD